MDMIVMGTHGASGIRELPIGSTAQSVIRNSELPVLAVKEFAPPLDIKNIVFASDFSSETLASFKETVKIAKKFRARIHLLNVDAPG